MKKLISIVLCAIMSVLPQTAVFADSTESCGVIRYKGYISPWAANEVEKAQEIGIADSRNDYDYVMEINREDFCELIYNYYTLIQNKSEAADIKNSFTDTDNEHIAVLNSAGIINGKSETEFAPKDLLTREEAATIIFRLINTVHPDWQATELWYQFDDSDEISDWAMDNIQRICNMEIMNGVGGGKFAPKDSFTTEQAIAALVRCYESFPVNTVIGGGSAETDIVIADASLRFCDKDGKLVLSASDILSCNVLKTENTDNEWHLELLLSDKSSKDFAEATREILQYPSGENYISIILNGNVISRPLVASEVVGNPITITGNFSEESAWDLAKLINSAR